ncbi:MAG TPA: metallophosphoesterase [Treponemataceae bacterium]|nr:metallophosphoesterase [Treponemataceae bacterium]
MKSIRCDLSRELQFINIYTFADWHIGDPLCNEDYIQQQIEIVKNDPHNYCIINGDVLNWALKTSVSDSYGEVLTPMQQLEKITDLLKPVKEKILFMTPGNHEKRSYKSDGLEVLQFVAKELNILDRYNANGATLFIRFGQDAIGRKEHNSDECRKILYTIYSQHGSGGGRKTGGKANRVIDMACIVNTDIYIHSHTHEPFIIRGARYEINACNSAVIHKEMLFINTAATLDYGGYGQDAEYKPTSLKSPVIYLSGTEKVFNATL